MTTAEMLANANTHVADFNEIRYCVMCGATNLVSAPCPAV